MNPTDTLHWVPAHARQSLERESLDVRDTIVDPSPSLREALLIRAASASRFTLAGQPPGDDEPGEFEVKRGLSARRRRRLAALLILAGACVLWGLAVARDEATGHPPRIRDLPRVASVISGRAASPPAQPRPATTTALPAPTPPKGIAPSRPKVRARKKCRRPAKSPARPVRPQPVTTAAHGAALGSLSLNVAGGWAHVSINGRHAGQTPLVDLPLQPGSHFVALARPDLGAVDHFFVTVRAGSSSKVVRKAAALR